ncbi:rhodanese family protein [Camelimonas sp. ID_303_24]
MSATVATLPAIAPERAHRLIQDGAVLVDIREADEYAREHIPGARSRPLSLAASPLSAPDGAAIIFHCRSGMRTASAVDRLANGILPGRQGYVLEGGLDAWKKAGLPVAADRSQPLEMQRQVQIGAGSLALAGVLLGFLVSPGFFLISGFVGAGLIMAGVTGFCGMARLLKHAPWNRAAAPASCCASPKN